MAVTDDTRWAIAYLTFLADLYGFQLFVMHTNDGVAHIQVGRRVPGQHAQVHFGRSIGLDAVASVQTWNNYWSGAGGNPLGWDEVPHYLAAWVEASDALDGRAPHPLDVIDRLRRCPTHVAA
jgi:hypothetical protein